VHDARLAAAGPNDRLRLAARVSGVAVCVPGPIGQHGVQLSGIVNVRCRDRDAADQSGVLVGRDVSLVAVHRPAPAMTRPARFAVMPNVLR
jgi:hypothetical protein